MTRNVPERSVLGSELGEAAQKEARPLAIRPSSLKTQANDDTKHITASDDDNETSASKASSLVLAAILIPGLGEPISNGALVTSGSQIQWVGAQSSLPSRYHDLRSTKVQVLMPGLWDCHCHLLGAKSFNFSSMVVEHPAVQGARLARGLHDILMSGFTSIRELGGWGPEVSGAIKEGVIPGPNIYSAGAALSQTAGHGDIFDLPVGWAWAKQGVAPGANGGSPGQAQLCLVDGVDECRKAVRLQIRRGAKLIKIFASGGVLSIMDDPMQQQFSDEEMSVIVEEAKRADRVVAAHVHGKRGIMAALRAGVHTLEHGTYLDEECIELMKEKGAMLVATRTIVIEGVKHPELMSPESYEKMLKTAKHHEKAYALAIKSGVKIALGTDLGISVPNQSLSLGKSGSEPSYAVASGMTPLQAIEAATANGPATLGPQAPLSGQLKAGYDADFIALKLNPLDDIKILADVDNMTHVWKGGKLYKRPDGTSPYAC